MTTTVTDANADRKLSVVIPNFNYGRYLATTIASVVAQDYANMELIVVDDASTDDSVAQAQAALAASGLAATRLIALEQNVGKLGALNRALEFVTGHYFILLDSDDLLKPGYVRRTIAELEAARAEDPSVAFLYTDCTLIDAKGEEIGRGKSTAWDPALLQRYSFVPEPALTLTAPVLESAPYDESIRRGTKHHKWMKIVEQGWNGHHVAEPLFSYRMHDSNLSGIGKRVTAEVESGIGGERILSGYWPLQTTEA